MELAGREKERLVTHINIPQHRNDFAKILAKPQSNSYVMFALSFIIIWRAVRMRMMEEDNAIREAAKYMGMSLREEQNLAVKGI